jgi:hypothetical protein
MNLYQLFEDLNAEEEAGKNKKKQKENDVNLDDAFMRFEFLELVMRWGAARCVFCFPPHLLVV